MTLHFANCADPCQERLQREYMSANKQRDTGIDESDEEDLDPALTGAGKLIKKLMSKHEKNEAYESDEESNPYASSVVCFGLLVL
jgi:transcription initiation factor TFIIF subunit alpha